MGDLTASAVQDAFDAGFFYKAQSEGYAPEGLEAAMGRWNTLFTQCCLDPKANSRSGMWYPCLDFSGDGCAFFGMGVLLWDNMEPSLKAQGATVSLCLNLPSPFDYDGTYEEFCAEAEEAVTAMRGASEKFGLWMRGFSSDKRVTAPARA